ncbi:MAG TPA: bifunctional lysylphosphatidylglycerol flippase/synthetase MprF [Nevskiaceae bacterium]
MSTRGEEPVPAWERLRRVVPIVLIVVVGALLLAAARRMDLGAIQRALAAVSPGDLLLLALGGLVGVAVMSAYDVLAARLVAVPFRAPRALRIGFLANGINNVANVGGMAGSSLRVLLLTRGGVEVATAIRYALLVVAAAPLGLSVLAWAALIRQPALLSATPVPEVVVLAVLAVAALYLPAYAVLATTRFLHVGRLRAIAPIGPGGALGFLALSLADWAVAGAVVWASLAVVGVQVSPATVAAAFALATILGVASLVPAGLGVFDATFAGLLAFQGAEPGPVVAALVLYRVAYYLVPLLVALTLSADELRTVRRPGPGRAAMQLLAWPMERAVFLGIKALAWLTAASGVVLLGGAAFPNLLAHSRILHAWLPLGTVEASHMASVVVGVALVFVARGLSLRLNRALWMALGLLLAGAIFGLLRGLDWGSSLVLVVVAVVLWLNRSAFDEHGSLARQLGEWHWIAALGLALLVYFVIGEAFYPAHRANVLRIAASPNGMRFLRGLLIALVSVIVFVIWSWPRWPRPALERPSEKDLDALVDWLTQHGSNSGSHLMLLGDKIIRYGANRSTMIGFAAIHNRLIALGDPAGEDAARRAAIADFRSFAESLHCTPAFYQVGPAHLSDYLDCGFALFKLGESGRVDMSVFSMRGKSNDDKRSAVNRAGRLGMRFALETPPLAAPLMAELRAVSDDWLGERPAEKAFSLGCFSEPYLQRAPVAVVRDANGALLAFASVVPSYGHRDEYSIDLMRHRRDAPSGTMDFLFVELMLEAQKGGYRWFNLGMAPLAGVGDTPWASTSEQLARLTYEHGSRFYNYKGLRAFKEKWQPVWQSMYLAYPPHARLASLQLDIAALIAGGYRRVVAR